MYYSVIFVALISLAVRCLCDAPSAEKKVGKRGADREHAQLNYAHHVVREQQRHMDHHGGHLIVRQKHPAEHGHGGHTHKHHEEHVGHHHVSRQKHPDEHHHHHHHGGHLIVHEKHTEEHGHYMHKEKHPEHPGHIIVREKHPMEPHHGDGKHHPQSVVLHKQLVTIPVIAHPVTKAHYVDKKPVPIKVQHLIYKVPVLVYATAVHDDHDEHNELSLQDYAHHGPIHGHPLIAHPQHALYLPSAYAQHDAHHGPPVYEVQEEEIHHDH